MDNFKFGLIFIIQIMNFSTNSMTSFGGFDKVPEAQLNSLLKRRITTDNTTSVEEFDVEASKELESYCKSRGIMAMNLGHMNPRAALQFLKNQLGDKSPILKESKRGLLHG